MLVELARVSNLCLTTLFVFPTRASKPTCLYSDTIFAFFVPRPLSSIWPIDSHELH